MKIIPSRYTIWPQSGRSCLASLLALALCIRCASLAAVAAPMAVGRGTPSPPGCSTTIAPAALLRRAHTAMVGVPGSPFDVVTTADGGWSFVSLGSSVGVFSDRSFAPRLVQQIAVPGHPLGEALTHDGRYLLVADDSGAAILDVAAAERGRPRAVLGLLSGPGAGGAGVEVAVSPDDHYAFVTRETADDLAVFDLRKALAGSYGPAAFVGAVALGVAPAGLVVSPGGRWLYVTSEARTVQVRRTVGGRRLTPTGQGTLSVLDLARAETVPARAVVATVSAGCSPVRVITSGDGRTVWVSARGSDALLGFAAAALLRDPSHALVARVPVGAAPVGLLAVRHDTRLIVADSNRFAAPGAAGTLSVVDTAAALAGRPALLGDLPAGGFPRQLTLEPGGRVLLATNFASAQLEAVDLSTVP